MSELSLYGLPRRVKTLAIESAYVSGGHIGCFLPNDDEAPREQRQFAEYADDRFRDTAGANQYRFSDQASKRVLAHSSAFNGVDGCHIYTALAFEEFGKHNAGYPDWLLRMLQNSGNCVGASWQEMMCVLLGVKSADPHDPSAMFALAMMIVHARRRGCGQGWYMGACAEASLKYGWSPATVFDGRKLGDLNVPDLDGLQCDDEDEQERICTHVWCNNKVPARITDWCAKHFMYESGAVSRLDDASLESIMKIGALRGCIHHGSTATAGPGGLDSTRRIGGHAQTHYGVDGSDQCVEFFRRRGLRNVSRTNPVMLQGQTWGGGWSGELDDEDWPFGSDERGTVYTWADVLRAMSDQNWLHDIVSASEGNWGWGPKNQGAWIVLLDTFQAKFMGSPYVYLPEFGGIPGKETPQPSGDHPEILGTVQGEETQDGTYSLRGHPTVVIKPDQKPGRYVYTMRRKPGVADQFEFSRKILGR